MLDLTTELAILQVIPLAAQTATFNSTGVAVNTLDTGDLDLASLNVVGITGSGTITVQLQGSTASGSGYTNLPVTPMMPATVFPVVSANLAAPELLAVDPRALQPYIRAAVAVTGSISAFTIELQLFGRLLQIGFNTNSG